MKHNPQFVELVEEAKTRVKECMVDDVKSRIDKGDSSFLLIDVREDHEWERGHIPGALHLGKGIIERDIHKVAEDPNQEVILYCGGGFRSALAADNLQKMGYSNVISMDGGFRGWNESGYPVKTES